MRGRGTLPALAVLVWLLAATPGAIAHDTNEDPAAQGAIDRLVATIVAANSGGPADSIPGLVTRLQEIETDREELLFQIVLYMTHGTGNERAMGAALLVDHLAFTDDEKARAIAPRLDTDDDALRGRLWDVLSTVEPLRRARVLAARSADGAGLDEARREIDLLSRHAEWWVRLYVAGLLDARPELGSAGTLERLRSDANEQVRRAAGGAAGPGG